MHWLNDILPQSSQKPVSGGIQEMFAWSMKFFVLLEVE